MVFTFLYLLSVASLLFFHPVPSPWGDTPSSELSSLSITWWQPLSTLVYVTVCWLRSPGSQLTVMVSEPCEHAAHRPRLSLFLLGNLQFVFHLLFLGEWLGLFWDHVYITGALQFPCSVFVCGFLPLILWVFVVGPVCGFMPFIGFANFPSVNALNTISLPALSTCFFWFW